ncbi:MAG: O-antigen ligase family protein [Erythrobacter sp.]
MTANAPKYLHPQHTDTSAPLVGGMFQGAQSTFWAILAVLIIAIAFGGGGSKYGIANLIVQLAALIALSFHGKAFWQFWTTAPAALRLLIGLSILLPLLFVVPLPPSVWAALPGRELMVQSYDLLGGQEWASASVDPFRTMLAVSALIAPLALLTIGWNAPRDRLVLVGWVAVGLGLANFLIGIPQVLSNSETGVFYPENPMPGVLFGSFANRNSTGLFLVGALALAALLPMPQRLARADLPMRVAVCLFLVVAIVLTRSRTALVLALIPMGLVVLRMILFQRAARRAGHVRSNRSIWITIAPIAVLIAIFGAVLIAAPGRIGDVAERFERTEDARSYIWEDAAYSADRYWPVGSGMGTFDDVFQVDESLENMTLRRAGRAHNDYLEVAIEAGVPGLLLIAGWLILLIWLSWRARNSHDRWIAWSGATILFAIALQSVTDYPLRNMAILTFASFALLILVRFGAPNGHERPQEVLP